MSSPVSILQTLTVPLNDPETRYSPLGDTVITDTDPPTVPRSLSTSHRRIVPSEDPEAKQLPLAVEATERELTVSMCPMNFLGSISQCFGFDRFWPVPEGCKIEEILLSTIICPSPMYSIRVGFFIFLA